MAKEEKEETETSESEKDQKKTDETKDTAETKDTSTEDTSTEESEETKDTEGSEDKEPSQADWRTIAQEEREAREKAEKALATKRFKAAHPKKDEEAEEVPEDQGEEGEEKPLTASRLEAILQRERETTRKEVMAGETKRIARELAASDEEAEAIVEIFNSHIFPETLPHEEKVKRAFYIAHGPRLTAKIMELRRSLQSRETKGKSGAENVHRDQFRGTEPKIAPLDKAEIQRLGFKWDGKRYSKKLRSGKTLVKDSKTGKTFIEG